MLNNSSLTNIGQEEYEEAFLKSLKNSLMTIPNLPVANPEVFPSERQHKTRTPTLTEIGGNQNKLDFTEVKVRLEAGKPLFDNTVDYTKDSISKTQQLQARKGYLPAPILQELLNAQTLDENLDFDGFVAVFTMGEESLSNFDMQRFSSFFQRGGYYILDQEELSANEVRNLFVMKELLTSNTGLKKREYEELMQDLTGVGIADVVTSKESFIALTPMLKNFPTTMNVSRLVNQPKSAGLGGLAESARQPGSAWLQSSARLPGSATLGGLARMSGSAGLNSSILNKFIDGPKYNEPGSSLIKKLHHIVEEAQDCIIFLLKENEGCKNFLKYYATGKSTLPEGLNLFYSSKDRKTSFLDAEVFFPEVFKVNFMTSLILPTVPKLQQKIMFTKLEDVLNMNGYTVLSNTMREISKDTLAEAFKEHMENAHTFADFLLPDRVSNLMVAGKMGKPMFVDPCNIRGNFYTFENPLQTSKFFKSVLPDYQKFGRVIVILRPLLIKNGLSEFCLQLFRINGFIVIKRISVTLTEAKAHFLARLEQIDEESEDQYHHLMLDGQCEVFLLSHYGATQRAEVLVNGPITKLGNEGFDRNDPDVEALKSVQRGSQTLMTSLRNLISIPKILASSLGQKRTYSSSKSPEKSQLDQKISSLKHSARVRHLNETFFNFLAFSTYNEQTTEELSSMFFPDVTQMSNIIVLVKPKCVQYTEQIISVLQDLNYRVLDAKRVKLNDEQTKELLDSLQSTTANVGVEIVEWKNQTFDMLSLIKSAARREVLSLLRNFKITTNFRETIVINKDTLYQVLVPCWNERSTSLMNTAVYAESRKFDSETFKKLENERKVEMLDYILQYTVGDYIYFELEQFKKDTSSSYKELGAYTHNHTHILAHTKDHGSYEVRIRKFLQEPEFYLKQCQEEYQLVNYYYKQISRYYNQKSPSFYQFRVILQQEDALPDQIFDVQEYMGEPFIEQIAKEMVAMRKNEAAKSYVRPQKNESVNRGSIVAFMYGARLAVYIKKLEKIQPVPKQLMNFGPLKFINDKVMGTWLEKDRYRSEVDNYFEILDKCCAIFNASSSEKADVEEKLERIFNSETWRSMRDVDNIRIMPATLNPESLRIFQKAEDLRKATIHSKFQTIKYTYERDANIAVEDTEQNVDFALSYVKPEYRGRYTLIAMVRYLLEFELKIFEKRTDLVGGDETEYNHLIDGLVEGLNQHYEIESRDEQNMSLTTMVNTQTVDCFLMEQYLVYMDYLDRYITELDYYRMKKLEKESSIQKEMAELEENLARASQSEREKALIEWRKVTNSQKEEFSRLNRMEVLTEGKIKVLFNHIRTFDVIYSREDYLIKKGIKQKIPKSRYYINIYNEMIEKNIYHEKYLDNIQHKDNVHNTDYKYAPFFQNMDVTQAGWIKRPDFWVNGVRSVEEDDRKDHTVVDRLEFPNEEKEKSMFRTTMNKFPHFLNIDL